MAVPGLVFLLIFANHTDHSRTVEEDRRRLTNTGEDVAFTKLAHDHFKRHKRPLRITADALIWVHKLKAACEDSKNYGMAHHRSPCQIIPDRATRELERIIPREPSSSRPKTRSSTIQTSSSSSIVLKRLLSNVESWLYITMLIPSCGTYKPGSIYWEHHGIKHLERERLSVLLWNNMASLAPTKRMMGMP